MTYVIVLFIGLSASGCASLLVPSLLLDAASTGVSVYQQREQRKATETLTGEVKLLREEIQKWRENGPR